MSIPRPFARVLFALPWVSVILASAWLVIARFPPSGVFQAATVLDGKSPWIFPFLPAERTTPPGQQPDGWMGQRILSDPTYFTARVPGPYESVDVSVEFRPIQQPLLELGMIHDAAGTALEMRPMYSSELDSREWLSATSTGVSGYVRHEISTSRLTNPDTRGLSVWDASGTMPLMQDLPGHGSSVAVSLRGAHDFYLVPTDRVHMTFTLQPVNRKSGTDLVSFRVFRGDEEIYREAFDVNGSRETRMGQTFEHSIDIADVMPGVYRISFAANDDVFIRQIETTSARWVVGPRLVFGDVVGYATTTQPGRVWTNTRHLVAETFHVEGVQTLHLGMQQTRVSKTHTAMRLDRDDPNNLVELTAPKGDMRLIGDGFFAFVPSAFFEPSPRRLTDNTHLNTEHVDAVITSYVRPDTLGDGWYRSHMTFALDPTLDRLRFVLSAPGALSRNAAVDVRRLVLTYHRRAETWSDWLKTLRQELVNAWHHL